MIEIDGSFGEGGGQVLRSALTLSILTGQPFRILNIRAGRSTPGLRPQHLRAVAAAAAISQAEVTGATPGSLQLAFSPRAIRSGRYRFAIGSAGSTSLVIQTIFLPLSLAISASSVIITGGTHVPKAPCFDYLAMHWLPMMQRLGFSASIKMDKTGFYPEGGGKIEAIIRPISRLSPIDLLVKPALHEVQGISAVANLDMQIALRQKRAAFFHLQDLTPSLRVKTLALQSPGKGTYLVLLARFFAFEDDNVSLGCFTSLGEKGKPAEGVAAEACQDLRTFVESRGAVDIHLADQLLLPLAIIPEESTFSTPHITPHIRSNLHVIQSFLPVIAGIEEDTGAAARVWIKGCAI